MYFISPPADPKIFLMCGLFDQQFLGFGEKDGKLCIYKKAVYDNGQWKKFFLTDINVVKAECCKNGLHVATGMFYGKLWFAARENEFTRFFSINIGTMKFTRYQMLQEEDNSLLHNLNLCCKCLSPTVRFIRSDSDGLLFDIVPQKYQNKIGIIRIRVTINKSQQCSITWKNLFTLDPRPVSSNIFISEKYEILSIIKKSKEDAKIQNLYLTAENFEFNVSLPKNSENSIDWIWDEVAFCIPGVGCLTRRKTGDKIFLQFLVISIGNRSLRLSPLVSCTVDSNFPSLESVHFFVNWRDVDEDYISKRSTIVRYTYTENYAIPSDIYFQLADGSTVTIPLEVLSLSQLSYIALSRVPLPSQQEQRPLPVAEISLMYYFFQRIRNLCGESKKEEEDVSTKGFFHKEVDDDEVWMSQEFIKKKIGWPRVIPLIKDPNLPTKSE